MNRKFSMFSQILKLLPRSTFDQAVRVRNANKWRKTFRCWDHLVTMIYSQLTSQLSLRNLATSFNSHNNHHYHLGTRKPIKRTTISDANKSISHDLYREVLSNLITQARGKVKRELNDMVHLIDSTPIQLKGLGFDWVKNNYRITGMKVHTVYKPSSELPIHFIITPANVNDITVAKKLPIEEGATYVFDKAYYDFIWWKKLHNSNCRWVTRLKKDSPYKIIEKRETHSENVLSDCVICLTSSKGKELGIQLRRLEIKRDNNQKTIVIISNDLSSSADELSKLYKSRWQIELFFKWVKQNLRIKKYLGVSENAVKVQILTALITYVLLFLYRLAHQSSLSMRKVLLLIRENVFHCKSFRELTKPPPCGLDFEYGQQLEIMI